MSSPIVKIFPSDLQKALVILHQKIAHSNRINKLAKVIGKTINDLFPSQIPTINLLDVGCGDMRLAEKIEMDCPHSKWTCTDIHELPTELKQSEKWKKYIPFDGTRLPFADSSFDVVLFSDVLHHCLPEAITLLQEARRVGRYIIVKDHFEHGVFSRQVLRLMDWVGNYGYGVSVPDQYFTKERFFLAADKAGFKVLKLHESLALYPVYLSPILRPNLQFLAVLDKKATC